MMTCDNNAVLYLIEKALKHGNDVLTSSPVPFQVLEILREAIVDRKMDVTLSEPLDDVA